MTEPEKMTLEAALDLAHDVLGEQSGEVLGRDADYSQELAQAAAVLRAFRERGLPLFEAAVKASAHVDKHFPDEQSREGAYVGDMLIFAMLDAYRRWKEGE